MKTVKSLFHGKQAFPLMKLLFNPFPQPFVVCLGVDTGTRALRPRWAWSRGRRNSGSGKTFHRGPLNIDLGAEPKQKSVYSWVSRFLHKIMTKSVFTEWSGTSVLSTEVRVKNGLLGSVRWFYSRLRRQFLWFWRQCSFDPPDRSTNSKIIQVVVSIFFIFIPIWGRSQIWLIFFRGVETTN